MKRRLPCLLFQDKYPKERVYDMNGNGPSDGKITRCKTCGAEIEKSARVCPNCGVKRRRFKWWYILIAIAAIAILSNLGDNETPDGGDISTTPPAQTDRAPDTDTAPPRTEEPEPTTDTPSQISYSTELGSGHYTVGIDFPAGTYDIVAVSGGGNVSSSNIFSGGINAIMSVDTSSGMYEQEYSNIRLPEGTVLSISGVRIKITSDNASGEPLKKREQPIAETVELGNGNFVAGEDFPTGVYDIVAISGGGNVSSDNMFDGGINAIMGVDQSSGMYEQGYKNIELPEGTTLSVDGVRIQLVPST